MAMVLILVMLWGSLVVTVSTQIDIDLIILLLLFFVLDVLAARVGLVGLRSLLVLDDCGAVHYWWCWCGWLCLSCWLGVVLVAG